MEQMTFQLKVFEGPLDLLLHLISKNKVSIYDIPISDILDQYLLYLEQMKYMDLEIASDFIAMAAQLMYIKSKMLLPKPEEEEYEDPRRALVQSLIEYKQIKEGSQFLRERENIGAGLFVRAPQMLAEKDKNYRHTHKAEELRLALSDMIDRIGRKIPPPVTSFTGIIKNETTPVSEKITQVLRMLFTKSKLKFMDFIKTSKNRSDIVASFLAVLELSKENKIEITDDAGEITLNKIGGDM